MREKYARRLRRENLCIAALLLLSVVWMVMIGEGWFFGGAVNPRDGDLVITEDGDELVFRGRKSFSTGGVVSDLTVLEGVVDGTGTHVFAIVPTDQPAGCLTTVPPKAWAMI